MAADDAARMFPGDHGYTIAVAASQCCDIASDNLEHEPDVMFVLGRPDTSDAHRIAAHGRNPRLFRFEHDGVAYVLYAVTLCAINKRLLAEQDVRPTNTPALSAQERKAFVSWLAERFRRPALPDELNDACGELWPYIADKLRSRANQIAGVFVRHFESENGYDLQIYFVSFVQQGGTPREDDAVNAANIKAADELAAVVRAAFPKKARKGIVLEICKGVSELEFSLHDVRTSHRMSFDHISYRTNPAGATIEP